MVDLSSSVQVVCARFSFSNPALVPEAVKQLKRKTGRQRQAHKRHRSGSLVIEPVENVCLGQFPAELEEAGYELVDVLYKELADLKDPRGERTYHVVRFLFARGEYAEPSEEFSRVKATIRRELLHSCVSALWQVRVFCNPFYADGEEVPGQQALSIDLRARKPLFQPDGQPTTVWLRDDKGRRIGRAPVPVQPECDLRVTSEGIQLMARPS